MMTRADQNSARAPQQGDLAVMASNSFRYMHKRTVFGTRKQMREAQRVHNRLFLLSAAILLPVATRQIDSVTLSRKILCHCPVLQQQLMLSVTLEPRRSRQVLESCLMVPRSLKFRKLGMAYPTTLSS